MDIIFECASDMFVTLEYNRNTVFSLLVEINTRMGEEVESAIYVVRKIRLWI